MRGTAAVSLNAEVGCSGRELLAAAIEKSGGRENYRRPCNSLPLLYGRSRHKLRQALPLKQGYYTAWVSRPLVSSSRMRPLCASASKPRPFSSARAQAAEDKWQTVLDVTTSMYPVYVILGGILAVLRPATFEWFTSRGPDSYSLALGAIMLATGLTLRLEDLLDVIVKRPVLVVFGFCAQFIIMPLIGLGIATALQLPQSLKVGLILLSCCPGGTASNVVTYIAHGDVALSIVMTIASTFGAVVLTPMLTEALAGALVPVDIVGLSLSTLKVVLFPTVLGAWLQSSFPQTVARVTSFSPTVSVLISSLLASSVFSANATSLLSRSTTGAAKLASRAMPETALATASAGALSHIGVPIPVPLAPAVAGIGKSMLSSAAPNLVPLVAAVLLLHAGGFFFGYLVSLWRGLGEQQRRAISIEVGMQNSSLGVVLATKHFSDPSTPLPAALSAVLMNVMGSLLAVVWRQGGPPPPTHNVHHKSSASKMP